MVRILQETVGELIYGNEKGGLIEQPKERRCCRCLRKIHCIAGISIKIPADSKLLA